MAKKQTSAPAPIRHLSDLTADPLNPRDITLASLEGLKFSLDEFGDLSGITWNKRTHELVCGHQRVRALVEQYGDLEINGALEPGVHAYTMAEKGLAFNIRIVDWDRPKQRAANLAANNPHIAGHFTDALQGQLKEMQSQDQELLQVLRLDELVIEDLLLETADPNLNAVPGLPKTPKTVLGDLYQLGRHRLICGDCRDMATVEKLCDGRLADMIVTDPPYNVDYVGGTKEAKKIENDKMSNDDFLKFLRDAFVSVYAISKPGAPLYVFHGDSEGENFRRAYREAGFLLKQCLTWVKNSMVMGRQDFQWQHEPILYGWKDGGAHPWYADRKQTTIWRFDRPTKSEEHPTMKPVELVAYALRCSSKVGDTVADFFGGSGTTLIACEKARRQCLTMELDPGYCDVIVKRWETLTGRAAVLLTTAPDAMPPTPTDAELQKQFDQLAPVKAAHKTSPAKKRKG